MQGTFNVPPNQSLLDFFSPGVQVLKFTRVRLPGFADPVPFVALRRESVQVIDPSIEDEAIETPGSMGRTTPRQAGSPETRRLRTVLVNLAAAVGVAEWEGTRS